MNWGISGKIKLHCDCIFVNDHIDPFTKRHKLVHNGRFPKFEVLYCSCDTVKPIKIQ